MSVWLCILAYVLSWVALDAPHAYMSNAEASIDDEWKWMQGLSRVSETRSKRVASHWILEATLDVNSKYFVLPGS
jgi:hypothetical protein